MIKSNIKNQENQQKNTIFVGGLPLNTSKQDLANIFDGFGIIKSIVLPKHQKKNKIKGYALIEFKDSESVALAINHLNSTVFKDKRIAVKEALNSDEASIKTKEMQKRKLFVKNLPIAGTSEQKILEFFGKFGKVEKIQMAYSNKSQKFKGIAYVTMSKLDEAKEILSKGESFEFEGTKIIVRESKPIGEIFEERHQKNLETQNKKRESMRFEEEREAENHHFSGIGNLPSNLSNHANINSAGICIPSKINSSKSKKKNIRKLKDDNQNQSPSYLSQRNHSELKKRLKRNLKNQKRAEKTAKLLKNLSLAEKHNLLFRTDNPTQSSLRSQYIDSLRGIDNSNYRFNIENFKKEGEEKESDLVIRQVVKTEYRIKDSSGVVYLGQINEVNVWSSGREEESSEGSGYSGQS